MLTVSCGRHLALAALTLTFPALGAANGNGCGGGAVNSRSAAPDVTADWDVTYDNTLDVTVSLGGSTYTAEVGVQGGSVTIDHNGQPFTFDLKCERPEVICPSEVWPARVTLTQRNAQFPHRMFATLPRQECDGELVAPVASECGVDTNNPDCDDVCDGDIVTRTTEHFGVINEAGTWFELLLGAGIATNGINCALLGVSKADANLVTTGAASADNWVATDMVDGKVTTAYAGGCLWAGDPDDDGSLEAIVLGASVVFETGFVGVRR